ncbi:hypothetical protein GDO81_027373 [Engystomops pustulosus]|uniref:Vomeronasal type-1 receptor n=1 Tax=Engystomops pustulosus TaxID=76066 RepID=A0AAV6YK05_ENGPU|nr:hypothetical protein GDO81_027373 [Engystomops pustulosus]
MVSVVGAFLCFDTIMALQMHPVTGKLFIHICPPKTKQRSFHSKCPHVPVQQGTVTKWVLAYSGGIALNMVKCIFLFNPL